MAANGKIPMNGLVGSRFFLAAAVLLTGAAWAQAAWPFVPIRERVCSAEAIVVGKVARIEERFLSVSFEKSGWKSYFDLGHIDKARILKSDGRVTEEVALLFDARGQDDHPFAGVLTPRSVGDEGIWFIQRDHFSGSYLADSPDRFLPLSEEKEVVRILKSRECDKKKNESK